MVHSSDSDIALSSCVSTPIRARHPDASGCQVVPFLLIASSLNVGREAESVTPGRTMPGVLTPASMAGVGSGGLVLVSASRSGRPRRTGERPWQVPWVVVRAPASIRVNR
jgi:hypothetical protein